MPKHLIQSAAFVFVCLFAASGASVAAVDFPESGMGRPIGPAKMGDKATPKRPPTHSIGSEGATMPNIHGVAPPKIPPHRDKLNYRYFWNAWFADAPSVRKGENEIENDLLEKHCGGAGHRIKVVFGPFTYTEINYFYWQDFFAHNVNGYYACIP